MECEICVATVRDSFKLAMAETHPMSIVQDTK
jgi:hypothetical protein